MYKLNFYTIKAGIPTKVNTDNHVYDTLEEASQALQVLTFNMSMVTYMRYKKQFDSSYVTFTKCPEVYSSIDRTLILGMESIMEQGKTLYKNIKCMAQIIEIFNAEQADAILQDILGFQDV